MFTFDLKWLCLFSNEYCIKKIEGYQTENCQLTISDQNIFFNYTDRADKIC